MDPRTLQGKTASELSEDARQFRSRLEILTGQISELVARTSELQNEHSKLSQHLAVVESERERRTRPAPRPTVTDHALLRYIERVHGIDLDALRAAILTPAVVTAIQSGASAVIADDVKFVVKGNAIITVLGEEQRTKRKDARRGPIAVVEDDLRQQLDDYYQDRGEEAA